MKCICQRFEVIDIESVPIQGDMEQDTLVSQNKSYLNLENLKIDHGEILQVVCGTGSSIGVERL